MKHSVREEFRGILAFIGAIWAVFLLDLIVPLDFHRFGLIPRTLEGLIGIPTMPFLHANLGHIVSNTIPLLVLLMLLAGSKARSWEIVLEIVLLGGLLLWLFGRTAVHIGVSGLIFGLAAFLIASGFLEKRPIPLLVAVLVLFLYGGSLLSGVLPHFGSSVSWDGHLTGALAGGMVAYGLTRDRPRAAVRVKGSSESDSGRSNE